MENQDQQNAKSLGIGQRIAFRSIFVYFVLKTSLWSFIPILGSYLHKFYYYPSFFIQNNILKWHDPPRWEHPSTGSGDTLDLWREHPRGG